MKVDQHSIPTDPLLPAPVITKKTFSWKLVVMFLVCVLVLPYLLFSAYCPVWLAFQSNNKTEKLLNKVPHCPCRVNTTWDDEQFGFTIDSGCDARKSGYWNCRFHQGAKGCYRQKSKTDTASAQCCYDNNGRWISDWRTGAGTLDFYYPKTWKYLSTYQHFLVDVLSYLSCCHSVSAIFSSCEHYMKYRPSGTCQHI